MYARRRFVAVLLVCGVLATIHSAVAHAHGVRPSGTTVVVQSGDTLWGLGERYAPPVTDLRRWVFEVERLNGMTSSVILPGQSLRLPG